MCFKKAKKIYKLPTIHSNNLLKILMPNKTVRITYREPILIKNSLLLKSLRLLIRSLPRNLFSSILYKIRT